MRPVHVLGVSAQKDDGEHEHQNRPDDPVLHEREAEHAGVAKDFAQPLVLHLGQRRIHHEDEADGDGDVGGTGLEALKKTGTPGTKRPSATPTAMARKIQRSDSGRRTRGAKRGPAGGRAADLRV